MDNNKLYSCNMFIMKKKLLDNYASWLFAIFDELEKNIDISNYDDYNKRIYGFLSERLFNVWVLNNKLKIKEITVYNTEDNFIQSFIKEIFNKIMSSLKGNK